MIKYAKKDSLNSDQDRVAKMNEIYDQVSKSIKDRYKEPDSSYKIKRQIIRRLCI